MNNIHQLGVVKCPPGSKAIHPEFGWCEVVKAEGFNRTVIYEVHAPDETPNTDDLPEGVAPDEVLLSETIELVTVVVDVRDLHEVNPQKDMRPRETATRVLFNAGNRTGQESHE